MSTELVLCIYIGYWTIYKYIISSVITMYFCSRFGTVITGKFCVGVPLNNQSISSRLYEYEYESKLFILDKSI